MNIKKVTRTIGRMLISGLVLSLFIVVACGGGSGDDGNGDSVIGEGSPSNPVQLSLNVPHSGQADNILNADSFYFVDVISGVNYTIAVTNKSIPVAYIVTKNSSFSTPYLYISDDFTNVDEQTTQSTTGSKLYIIVESSGSEGAFYTITVKLAVPEAPTGVITSSGNANATVSWPSVTGASSYNIYWSTTSGSGISGTKISGVTSPKLVTGLTNGTTYYFVVTAVNSSGESSVSSEEFATPVAPIASFPATYNFDDGTLQGWTATGTWGVTSSTYNSANYSITDSPSGDYLNNTEYAIISPTFDLTGITNPTLTFWIKCTFGVPGDEWCFDYGEVQISTNGGATWHTWEGLYNTRPWNQHTIPLSSFKTNNVKIRFVLYSNGVNVFDGLYIDDIVVQ